MAIVSRVDPLDKDIELLIRQDLSSEAKSEMLATFARETLASAQQTNEEALGRVAPHDTFVDGQEGADESAVRPEGTIAYQFHLASEMFAWIDEQLRLHSPVGSGRDKHAGLYKRSHIFYADGVPADPLNLSADIEVGTFVNSVPYARRIEQGSSPQQPEGVYEVVAALAQRRFGNIAKITFTYSAVIAGHSVTQALAASSGQPWWFGGAGARKATGKFEKTLGATAHNKSEVRHPAIQVTVR